MNNNTKKLVVSLVGMTVAIGALAQGSLDFRNRNSTVTPTIDAPVFDVDGTTRLSGAGFLAQLYFSTSSTGVGAIEVSGTPAPFRTGAGAGYWDYGADFTRIVSGVAPGVAGFFQVRVWEAAAGSFAAAQGGAGKWTWSNGGGWLPITLGGSGSPPSVPSPLVGLTFIPEPSAVVLGLLGVAALLRRPLK